MMLRFNKLVLHDRPNIEIEYSARDFFTTRPSHPVIFMSHKTGDYRAEREAERISEEHKVGVYMAEWDENIDGDSKELPEYIMKAIRSCKGFLVHVVASIVDSMWIGYEIGGAHAMQMKRARIMAQKGSQLPSVVAALDPLDNTYEVDKWIRENVL